ncbi:MAG: adenylate kinase [Lysobacterales bacterium]|jgi:adenylate kinase
MFLLAIYRPFGIIQIQFLPAFPVHIATMSGLPILEDGNRLMRIVLLGAPGSGKGTQAALLEKELGVPHISTGELFRTAVSESTPLGLKVRSLLDRGELVPDDLTLELLEERMALPDAANGFILDGYPRNLVQAEALDTLLEKLGRPVDEAIKIDVDTEQVVARIAKRSAEQGRSDDSEGVVRNRMRVYQEQTSPVIGYYENKGLLTRVLGTGSIDDVLQIILSVLEIGTMETSA